MTFFVMEQYKTSLKEFSSIRHMLSNHTHISIELSVFGYSAISMPIKSHDTESLGECPGCGHRFTEDDILDGGPPLYGEPTVRCPNYDGTDTSDPHKEVFKDIEGTPHSVRVSNLEVDS